MLNVRNVVNRTHVAEKKLFIILFAAVMAGVLFTSCDPKEEVPGDGWGRDMSDEVVLHVSPQELHFYGPEAQTQHIYVETNYFWEVVSFWQYNDRMTISPVCGGDTWGRGLVLYNADIKVTVKEVENPQKDTVMYYGQYEIDAYEEEQGLGEQFVFVKVYRHFSAEE